jgi:hypothetical protein
MQWQKVFAGSGNNTAYAVTQTKDSGYAIFGSTEEASKSKAYLLKTDSLGNMQWQKTFSGSGESVANDGRQTGDGGYILAGATVSDRAAISNAYLVKADATGNMQWEQTFGASANSLAIAVQQTSDGGYVFCGQKESSATKNDVYLVKVQSDATPTSIPTPTPTPTPTPAPLSITSVQMVSGYPQYLEWDISNNGNVDVFAAPNAQFYKPIAAAPGYAQLGRAPL